ncbi:MAG: hypothetical protein ABI308_09030 [Mucilaginibacter sp.]
MKVEFLKDTQGDNGAVHITGIKSSEWPEIERRLQQPVKAANTFDRYGATESLNSILNGLITLTTSEQLWEQARHAPDAKRIAQLKALSDEVWSVNREPANFGSVEQMETLIAKYSPILLAEKKKALA